MTMENSENGPMMLVATSVLKPPPARISKLGAGIQLPRTVEIKTLIVCGVLSLVSVLSVGLLFGFGLQRVFITAAIGAMIGWLAVSYSPLKGESLVKWATLILGRRIGKQVREGTERLTVYIGVSPVVKRASGLLTISHGFGEVAPGSVDERGGVLVVEERESNNLSAIGRRSEEERG